MICKRVWVPEVCEKTIDCVRYERCVVKKQVPVTVCRWVSEPRTKTCTYQVCHMVRECRTKQVPYTVCRMVPETRTKLCTYRVCHMVQECHTKQVPYTVCRMVQETRTKACTYQVCHMVQECHTKQVPYTVCRMVPETRTKLCTYRVCRMVQECHTKQVPYTVCRMVSQTCVKQVPYTVCKPVHYCKTIQVPRTVCRQVPYTVTRCVPKVVCEQVPGDGLLPDALLPAEALPGQGLRLLSRRTDRQVSSSVWSNRKASPCPQGDAAFSNPSSGRAGIRKSCTWSVPGQPCRDADRALQRTAARKLGHGLRRAADARAGCRDSSWPTQCGKCVSIWAAHALVLRYVAAHRIGHVPPVPADDLNLAGCFGPMLQDRVAMTAGHGQDQVRKTDQHVGHGPAFMIRQVQTPRAHGLDGRLRGRHPGRRGDAR